MIPEAEVDKKIGKIRTRDRGTLSRAITLVESTLEEDRMEARQLLNAIQPYRKESRIIGITGTPGVGKSTFINTFVSEIQDVRHPVAVLTIDPSSGQSGGSILGDKIRMKDLLHADHVYIRTSPSKGMLGGISGNTWEIIQLCETAGYRDIFIETVGVGQSETEIQFLADEIWWLTMPGSGDEIQGIKKGILEIVGRVLVTRTDLDPEAAKTMRIQLQRAMKTSEIGRKALTFYEISSIDPGTMDILQKDYKKIPFRENRTESLQYWYKKRWQQEILDYFSTDLFTAEQHLTLWDKIRTGQINPWEALEEWRKTLDKRWGK